MATPAIGGVVSSETGTVSLTAVPVGGWMLAALVAEVTPATPSGWTSYGPDADYGTRVVGRVKEAGDTTLSGSWELVSVMWGTGAGTVWRSATGDVGSASLSLSGTTAGSRLVAVAPYLLASFQSWGYATGGAVTDHTTVAWDAGNSVCWWSAGTAAGGTATATRSTPGSPGDIQYAGPWVLVEIPEASNPATLTATALPGPPTAAIAGGSANPAALDAGLPGPLVAAIEGTLAGLDAALPGPPVVDWAGLATNPAVLAAETPGPPDADMSGVIFGVIALRRPPRTLAQLLRDGTRRRDLIRIQTGEHAGAELPVTSWSLTLDHLSTIRATGSAEVRHTPKLAALLDPRARTELAMILAIEDDDGHIHEWQKALLHTVPLERGHHMSIQLEDRAAWVRAAGMRTRIVMPAGMDIVQAITLLLGARAPWLPVAIPLSGTVLPQDAVLGGLGADPWEIASELARSIGHHLHIDPHGIARTAPITDLLTATPAAEWADDAADITDLQTTISDTDVVNVVGLPWTSQPGEGEPPDAITGGTEWWIDTTSSVSVAVMGDRVSPYPGDTSLIASAAQARDAAAAHGLTAQGIAVSVDIPGVRFDPRRDVGDIIRVRGQRLGLDLVSRLTGLTYASGAPTMGVTLADRRMI